MRVFAVILIFLIPSLSFAGAGLAGNVEAAKRQRAAQMQQQQMMMIEQQKALQIQQIQAQKQQFIQQQNALKQELIQRQQAVIAQQVANQKQAALQQQKAIQENYIAQQKSIQENLIARQQKTVQDMQKNMAAQQQIAQQQIAQQAALSTADLYSGVVPEPQVDAVVEMKKVWEQLESSSDVWGLMIDDSAKEVVVAKYIEDFYKEKIAIRKTPYNYVKLINQMASDNPDILKKPFKQILETAAIVEYDFDNGMSPDQLARQVLGAQQYEANKRRLGMQ